MPAATRPGGPLIRIEDCYVIIPNDKAVASTDQTEDNNSWLVISGGEAKMYFRVLPDITDAKSASYNDEVVIGRSSPLKTYSQSDNRNISMVIHIVITEPGDIALSLKALRVIQSAVYPREGTNGAPFVPPPVCRLKCGKLFSETGEVCVVLKQYSVKFPTEVSWDESTYVPFKFDIDTNWDVVYKSADLPGSERIFQFGA